MTLAWIGTRPVPSWDVEVIDTAGMGIRDDVAGALAVARHRERGFGDHTECGRLGTRQDTPPGAFRV
jgi:hypothetical protein